MKYTLLAILLWIVASLAGYGIYGLGTYPDQLDLIASLRADNSNMISKIAFLENNDWALAIQQLPRCLQLEIACLSERIKQDKKSRITD